MLGGHVLGKLEVLAIEHPVVGDVPVPGAMLLLDVAALSRLVVAGLEMFQPFRASTLGGYPLNPSAPLNYPLVLVATNSKDIVGR